MSKQRQRLGSVAVAVWLATSACFSKPGGPAIDDAASTIDTAIDARPCVALPAGAEFASYRNGAVGRLDGDALDDMVVFGTTPPVAPSIKPVPHVWVYHGATQGFDLQCPNEDHAFPTWTLVAAIDIAPFPGHDGLLIVAGISGDPAVASTRAVEYSVTDYATNGVQTEAHATQPASNGIPVWTPNTLNVAGFVASRTTADGSAQQIMVGGGNRVFAITWHANDQSLSHMGFSQFNGNLYQALYLSDGLFFAATAKNGVGAYTFEQRGDTTLTATPLNLTNDPALGVGANAMGSVRHTVDNVLLRSPLQPIGNDQIVEMRRPAASNIVKLTIANAPPVTNLQIQEVATRDSSPSTPIWLLLGQPAKPELDHQLYYFAGISKDQDSTLVPTNKNGIIIETLDIVQAGTVTPLLITGRFDGVTETARVMWKTATGMVASCYRLDATSALAQTPCKS